MHGRSYRVIIVCCDARCGRGFLINLVFDRDRHRPSNSPPPPRSPSNNSPLAGGRGAMAPCHPKTTRSSALTLVANHLLAPEASGNEARCRRAQASSSLARARAAGAWPATGERRCAPHQTHSSNMVQFRGVQLHRRADTFVLVLEVGALVISY